ncbi:hypothetical protein E3O55_00335 [Cryobacterium sp. MDB1-18-2]|uniref:Uncharacterized protein n=1 Tax=Cryobacterium glucosi TaxID=1259175 RepID=A0ABY2IQG8_9MICO|nr:hypothetical protein E3O46_10170 [Cryobacterium glucosi]TFC35923.1 hypothetical protein E3O55_00335 [Cryobacterium sp. MDB1-18-2]TFC41543.1 hypothetical protein E3O50_10780 [Cryobacterium sp. MDB1-18-1]
MGEADGKIKYFDPVMRDGRTPEEVLWDEKRREDGVRRQVHGFTRWGFSIALSRMRFARASAGAWAACSETGPPHVVNGVSVSSAGPGRGKRARNGQRSAGNGAKGGRNARHAGRDTPGLHKDLPLWQTLLVQHFRLPRCTRCRDHCQAVHSRCPQDARLGRG